MFDVSLSKTIPAAEPLITVVIAAYNRLDTLCELMESLSRQTYTAFEVVAVNDAGRPIDAIVGLYPELPIRVIDLPVNGGPAGALNAGIAAARGSWIMICDHDDLLAPCHLTRMVAQSADADVVFADVEIFSFRTEVDGTRIPTERALFAHDFDREMQNRYLTIVPSGTLYRRAIHDAIGPLDASFSPCYWDWDFFLRVADAGYRIHRVPVASVYYAFCDTNASADHASKAPDLLRLEANHGLKDLKTSNFFLLATEPDLAPVRRTSERVWDGQPFPSRLVTAAVPT